MKQATAKYLAHVLEKEGIQSELLDLAPGRSALVARLRSSAMADPSKALLLVAHMDVVGVDRSKWTVDPFAAVIKDGYLYGRGSIDDKGMLAANLAAFIALKRSNARLNRDVIFLATADEEQGGDASIKILISKYWDKFAAGYALNEGGEVFLKNGRVQYVAVQASEKVAMNVMVVARGNSATRRVPQKTMRWCISLRRSRKSAPTPRRRISPPSCADILSNSRPLNPMNWANGCACWTPRTAANTHRKSSPKRARCGIP